MPRTDEGDAPFVADDENLGAFGNGRAIFAARASHTPGSLLGVDEFARAACANWDAKPAERADHAVIGGVERGFAVHQKFEKAKDHKRRADTAHYRDGEHQNEPDGGIAREQVSGAAEPCEECGERAAVEPRQVIAPYNGAAQSGSVRVRNMRAAQNMHVREVQVRDVETQTSGEQRDDAEAEA